MAEIQSSAGDNRQQAKVRSKKRSTNVDLTPMVDLGFLLITFFIFTTTMSEPKAMKLVMPADGHGMAIGESAAFTIIPSGNNTVFYYHGNFAEALSRGLIGYTNYSFNDGIGKVIREKQSAMDEFKPGSRKDLMLIIKPDEEARYENMINVLDEVLINNVPHYAIVDIMQEEMKAIAQKKHLHIDRAN